MNEHNAVSATDPGLLIAFEGGEGAGKTTHSRALFHRLQDLNHAVQLVREPGGTRLGEHLRIYLKSDQELSPQAELLLFGAARAQLTAEAIRPALTSGQVVITDRFAASTVAYQGAGRGLEPQAITTVNDTATGGRYPDLNILLDVPPELGLERSAGQQTSFGLDLRDNIVPLTPNATGRRFDDLELSVHRRIRQAFLDLAAADPGRWSVIDASRPAEQVSEEVWQAVLRLFSDQRPAPPPEQLQTALNADN